MKKTLISLSVISAFTVVSSPAFATQTVDPVPGTADSPLAVVIGQGSTNTGGTSTGVAIGNESKSVNNSVAIGHKSSSEKDAVSIGEAAEAGEFSVAIGNNITSSDNSISLGHHSSSSNNSISMGHHSSSEEYGVSLGIKAKSGTHAVAIGDSSKATDYGVVVGSGSEAIQDSIAIGHNVHAWNKGVGIGKDILELGEYATAVGIGASASYNATALGHNASAYWHGVAIGTSALTQHYNAIAVGTNAYGYDSGVAVGRAAKAKATASVAIGAQAQTTVESAIAIGAGSIAQRRSGFRGKPYSSKTDTSNIAWWPRESALSVGIDTTYSDGKITYHPFTRQITGVAAGTELTDAVNVAQIEDLKLYGDDTYATFTSLNNYSTKDELAASLRYYATVDALNEASSSLTANLNSQVQNLESRDADLSKRVSELRTRLDNAHFIVEIPNGGNNPPANDVTGNSPGTSGGGGSGNTSSGGNQQAGNASATNSATVILGKKLNFTTDANILTSLTQDADGHTTVNISTADNMSVNSLTAKDITTDNLTVNQALTAKEITADTLTVNQTLKANSIEAQKVKAADIVATKSLTAPSITFTDGPTLSYNKDTGHLQYVSNSPTGGAGQGSVVHSIATTSDGITFGANEGSALVNLDNQKLDIKGADEFITTTIKTNGSGATLEIKMTDEFRIAVGNGNLNNGITIGAKDGYQEIHIHQGNVNMGGNRIQGVGDGIAPTDAVNKRQLDNAARGIYNKINKVDKDMRAGVAMAMAVASLPQAYMPGKSMLAMSAGTYRGQGGFALGLSHATENKSWVFKGAATADTRGNFGATIGAGYQF